MVSPEAPANISIGEGFAGNHVLMSCHSAAFTALWRHLLCEGGSTRALTSEAVDVVASVTLREARLVAMAIDGSDPGFTTSTALPRGDNGVAHASIRQPARAAEVQPIVPRRVQLSCSGHFCPPTPTEGLGLPEGETLGGGAMEHLTCTQKDGCGLSCTSVPKSI